MHMMEVRGPVSWPGTKLVKDVESFGDDGKPSSIIFISRDDNLNTCEYLLNTTMIHVG